MKFYLRKISLIACAIFMAVSFVACGDDDNEKEEPEIPQTLEQKLVGTWIETNLDGDEPPIKLVFNANQTGSLSFTIDDETRMTLVVTQDFKWTANTDANNNAYVEILTTGGDEILEDGKYTCSVIGDDLSFGGIRFKRI